MFDRLLLAIDDSPGSGVATDFASALAHQFSASVHVLYVNERLVGGQGLPLLSGEEATQLVVDTVRRLREAGVQASGSIHVRSHAEVAGCIVGVARDRLADAIVLGSRRSRHLIDRLFASRVRERVTRRTTLAVIVAPSPLELSSRVHVEADGLLRAEPRTGSISTTR